METDENYISDHCYVTGFGRLSVNGPRPSQMQYAQVSRMSRRCVYAVPLQ